MIYKSSKYQNIKSEKRNNNVNNIKFNESLSYFSIGRKVLQQRQQDVVKIPIKLIQNEYLLICIIPRAICNTTF